MTIKEFFVKRPVMIAESVLLALGAAGLTISGVSAAGIESIATLAIAAVSAVDAVITAIAALTKK